MINQNFDCQPHVQKLSKEEMVGQYKKAILKSKTPKFMLSHDIVSCVTLEELKGIYKKACDEIKKSYDVFSECNDEMYKIMANSNFSENRELLSFSEQLAIDTLKLRVPPLPHEDFIDKFYVPIASKHYNEMRINELNSMIEHHRKEVNDLREQVENRNNECIIS